MTELGASGGSASEARCFSCLGYICGKHDCPRTKVIESKSTFAQELRYTEAPVGFKCVASAVVVVVEVYHEDKHHGPGSMEGDKLAAHGSIFSTHNEEKIDNGVISIS